MVVGADKIYIPPLKMVLLIITMGKNTEDKEAKNNG